MDMPLSHKPRSQVFLLAGLALTLAILGAVRWHNAEFDRPFDEDEWLTVSLYTWVETQTSGESQQLNHIDDYYSLPPPTARQLALGAYFAAGRWPEPNNHIVNSLLVNATQVVSRSERWARLPALLGAMVFAGSLFWLCGPVLGWRYAAPLVLVVAWFWPYTVYYSQAARGYSWSLALQALWLIAAHYCARRPGSLRLNATCVGLAILTFMNVVSLALDWLFPAYLVLLFVRPVDGQCDPSNDGVGMGRGSPAAHSDTSVWRKLVLAQWLSVVAVGLTFLAAHLPAVLSSAHQYGEPFSSFGDFARSLSGIQEFLFPGPGGIVLALCGMIGTVLMIASRDRPFLGWLCVAVVAVSMIHFVATKRLPYARTLGYLLPMALLGFGYLVEQGLQRLPAGWMRLGGWLTLAAVAIGLAWPGARSISGDPAYDRFLTRLGEDPTPQAQWTIRFWVNKMDVAGDVYRPRDWDSPLRWTPGHPAQICFMLHAQQGDENTINTFRRGRIEAWTPSIGQLEVAEGPYRLVRLVGVTRALREGPAGRAVVLWYPDPEKLGIDSREEIGLADASGLHYLRLVTRHRVKLEVFGRLHAIAFIINSVSEYDTCIRCIEESIQRYGGSAVVFVEGG